jgi:hypothetical protein
MGMSRAKHVRRDGRVQMTELDFESIRKEFLDAYDSVRDLSDEDILRGSGSDFGASHEALARLGSILVTEQLASNILANPRFRHTAKRLGHIVSLLEQRRELDYAELVCASAAPFTCLRSLPSYPVYSQEVEMAVRASGIGASDSVLFLGSGPIPFSLILYAHKHHVRGIGVERNAHYAEISRRVVLALGLEGQIGVIHGDHFSLSMPPECTLIIIGHQAEPKAEIFAQLFNVLDDGARIAYRTFDDGAGEELNLGAVLRRAQVLEQSAEPSADAYGFREILRVRPMPPVVTSFVLSLKEHKR